MGELDDIKGLGGDDLKKIQSYIDKAYAKGKSDGSKDDNKSYGGDNSNLDTKTEYVQDATNLTQTGAAMTTVLNDFKNAANPGNFQGANY